MRFPLRGPRPASGDFAAGERIDVAAVIARALNMSVPVAEPTAAPPTAAPPTAAPPIAVVPIAVVPSAAATPVAVVPEPESAPKPESAPESERTPEPGHEPTVLRVAPAQASVEPTSAGATISVPFTTRSTDDPLVVALLDVANSLSYDLTAETGGGRWDEVVVVLPPDDDATFTARVDGAWGGWRPSLHSTGTLELFRAALQDVDPFAGYDIVVRTREIIVCRWPHRAWDGREPEPLDVVVDQPAADAEAGFAQPKRRRLTRLLRRS